MKTLALIFLTAAALVGTVGMAPAQYGGGYYGPGPYYGGRYYDGGTKAGGWARKVSASGARNIPFGRCATVTGSMRSAA